MFLVITRWEVRSKIPQKHGTEVTTTAFNFRTFRVPPQSPAASLKRSLRKLHRAGSVSGQLPDSGRLPANVDCREPLDDISPSFFFRQQLPSPRLSRSLLRQSRSPCGIELISRRWARDKHSTTDSPRTNHSGALAVLDPAFPLSGWRTPAKEVLRRR